MPPPRRTAVTVAPPTGAFAAFVTMPTMVPRDSTVAAAAESSSAPTTGIASPIDAAHQMTLCRYFAILMIVTLSERKI